MIFSGGLLLPFYAKAQCLDSTFPSVSVGGRVLAGDAHILCCVQRRHCRSFAARNRQLFGTRDALRIAATGCDRDERRENEAPGQIARCSRIRD